jgi:hypothetical protein
VVVDEPHGLPLRIDPEAESANEEEPAFVARPVGAPVYHGFPILEDVEVDGFKLGMITDWEAEPSDYGDAFIVAPDNSRCGLIWEIDDEGCVESSGGFTETRWGVWNVGFPHPMDSRENARRNLAHVLGDLRPKWEKWTDRPHR